MTTAAIASGAMGLISGFLAYRRGQNPYLWFALGFFFGLLGIGAIFFAPFSRKRAAPVKLPPQPYIFGPAEKFWYYLDAAHQQSEPMSYQKLTEEWLKGKINNKTYVWHEELTQWKPLEELLRTREAP